MKRLAALLLALVLVAILVAPVAAQSKYESTVYWIVLAEHGPNWKSQGTDEGMKKKMQALENLKAAVVGGRIITAGLIIDDVAADFVIIVEAQDEPKLRKMIKDSPLVQEGFYTFRTLAWQSPKGLQIVPVPLDKSGQ